MDHPGDVSPPGGYEPAVTAPPAPSSRPALPVRAALLTVAAIALAGVPFGVLWAVIAPSVPLRLTDAGLVYVESQPEQLIAADGWFAVLAVPLGVLAAIGVWLASRSLRGPAGLLTLTAGTVLAALLAWWLGRQIGLGDYRELLATAQAGAELQRPADLAVAQVGWWPPRVTGVLLVPAVAAATTYTLIAAWSRFPSLRPEEHLRPAEHLSPEAAPPSAGP